MRMSMMDSAAQFIAALMCGRERVAKKVKTVGAVRAFVSQPVDESPVVQPPTFEVEDGVPPAHAKVRLGRGACVCPIVKMNSRSVWVRLRDGNIVKRNLATQVLKLRGRQ